MELVAAGEGECLWRHDGDFRGGGRNEDVMVMN